jgi:hypothetical protein
MPSPASLLRLSSEWAQDREAAAPPILDYAGRRFENGASLKRHETRVSVAALHVVID